ncbi:MAG: glutaredoxin 3 [Pseudomonadota bacterium]
MKPVEIYTSPICPFCVRAKRLLKAKNVPFKEINVMGNRSARAEMERRAEGRHTVPQIFIDGQGIGGCDELHALDAEGRLDALLAA